MVDYKAMQNSSNEKETIADHHQDKVDALRGRFAGGNAVVSRHRNWIFPFVFQCSKNS